MLVLLPPSETKRPGGEGPPLDLEGLALTLLREPRDAVVDALVALAADEDLAARVLKLSEKRRHEIADNAALRTAATMPAIDRYTGVLFDALDAAGLDADARAWLGEHIMTSIPGLPALRRVWAHAVTDALAELRPGFVLDLRSEAYAALGPVPTGVSSVYVRVVTPGEGGAVRALNHFNKHAKGDLVRSLALTRPRIESLAEFRKWARAAGWALQDADAGEIALIV